MTSILKPRAEAELDRLAHDPYCALYLPLWKLDGASGTYFRSTDAHGTRFYTDSSVWTPLGRHTTKLGEYVNTPASEPVFDIVDGITLEIYMKLDALEAGKYPRIVSHKYENSYGLFMNTSGNTGIAVTTTEGYDSLYSKVVPLNKFTLLTSTYDSCDNRLRNYHNGLFVNSKVHTHGGKIAVYPHTFFVGNIIGYSAFVFVYSRALTPPEIQHHGRVARRLFQ